MNRALLAVCIALLAASTQAADGDPVAGKRKTSTCNACHGVSGFKSMPRLGGQSAAYIVSAMHAYKDGKRSHGTMRDVAGALTARDIADLGAYYASIARSGPENIEEAPALIGPCAACHGMAGDQPVAADVPIIAGQTAAYLEQTLKEYLSKSRFHEVMQAQAASLDDAQIAKLATFFAGRSALSVK